jgi:hypothetical protein
VASRALLGVSLLLVLGGCGITSESRGVVNEWRSGQVAFEPGRTTESEVMQALGPPSQLIDLGNRTVFYYVLEEISTTDMTLVLFNTSSTEVRYDRAIFFFDSKGVLTEQSVSREAVDYEGEEEEE